MTTNNVALFPSRSAPGSDKPRGPSDTGGNGNPPGGGDMEKRIEKLEQAIPDIRERLVRVETKLEGIEKNMVTKAELLGAKAELETSIASLRVAMAEGFTSQTRWFVGTAVVLAGIAFTAARFIH